MAKTEKPIAELKINTKLYEMTTPDVKSVVKWLRRTATEISKHNKKYTRCSFKYFGAGLIAVILFLSGCVSARYNVKTGELVYHRFGDQKLSGVIVEIIPSKDGKPDELNILLESQQSDARMMQTALEIFKAGMEAAK